MKKLLLAILFCATTQLISAQNNYPNIDDYEITENKSVSLTAHPYHEYVPTVREGVQWVYCLKYYDINEQPHFMPVYYEFKGDTIVDGRECKKCYRTYGEEAVAYYDGEEKYTFTKEPMLIACCFEKYDIHTYKDLSDLYSVDLWATYTDEYCSEMWNYQGGTNLSFLTPHDAEVKWYRVYRTRDNYGEPFYKKMYDLTPLTLAERALVTFNISEEISINGTTRYCFRTSSNEESSRWIEGIGLLGFRNNDTNSGGNFLSPFAQYRARCIISTSLNHVIENGEVVYLPEIYNSKILPTSGVDDVKVTTLPSDDSYYNLQGQRVSEPAAGIYIHNGKKVVVK